MYLTDAAGMASSAAMPSQLVVDAPTFISTVVSLPALNSDAIDRLGLVWLNWPVAVKPEPTAGSPALLKDTPNPPTVALPTPENAANVTVNDVSIPMDALLTACTNAPEPSVPMSDVPSYCTIDHAHPDCNCPAKSIVNGPDVGVPIARKSVILLIFAPSALDATFTQFRLLPVTVGVFGADEFIV